MRDLRAERREQQLQYSKSVGSQCGSVKVGVLDFKWDGAEGPALYRSGHVLKMANRVIENLPEKKW